jgi:hypothetical protein
MMEEEDGVIKTRGDDDITFFSNAKSISGS